MSTTWRDALQRVATALARRHSRADGEDSELTGEAGFTLIELMVVLVIMGILMAIAIPTFLGVTSSANDTSTQSNLANVIIAAKAIWAKSDGYPKTLTMAKQLAGSEPEFTYLKTGAALTSSAKQGTIAVKTTTTTATTGTFIAVAYMTKTHECWVAKNVATGSGVTYGYVKPGATKKTVAAATCTTTKGGTAATVQTTATHPNKWPLAPTGH